MVTETDLVMVSGWLCWVSVENEKGGEWWPRCKVQEKWRGDGSMREVCGCGSMEMNGVKLLRKNGEKSRWRLG
ncbi:hypothetical protein V6N13_016396 [Hibiscus sabdariffa]|uniref:Uncharacterized protein n=2 Tax=Hibiscus sabdariffa TaxID=183260 RepID=A0ABR2A695_9ROSI